MVTADSPQPEDSTSFEDLLVRKAPGKFHNVALDLTVSAHWNDRMNLELPVLRLYCGTPTCKAELNFKPSESSVTVQLKRRTLIHLQYLCANCEEYFHTFSMCFEPKFQKTFSVAKIGQIPTFGPPLPRKADMLLGEDKANFLKGRQCENQGLGIGAFAYYRRVIESQRNKIFDEIIRVISATSNDQELIQDLERAKREVQFKKSFEEIKHALPPTLLINGENPITLLHSALSVGLHSESDAVCLENAQATRIVLFELAEKLSNALKDDAELANAVARLSKVRAGKAGLT